MQPQLSKLQEAVLVRARINGGACPATTAYTALLDLGDTARESAEGSLLATVSQILQSLVELGLMHKTGPGKYDLTPQGFRVAETLGEKFPFA